MLNHKACLLFVLLVVAVAFKTNAQPALSEEKKDDYSESAFPDFKDGIPGLIIYLKKITPILLANTKDVNNLPTSLKMILTIDKTGKVTDVEFPDTRMEKYCQSKVREELLKMKGWKAAEYNGKPVVSKYPLRISCLLWSE